MPKICLMSRLNKIYFLFRMDEDYTKWDLKWDCGICKEPAKDTVALFEQYFRAVRRVKIFRDSDGVKWVNCFHCDTWYHWACVVSMSEQDTDLTFPLLVYVMPARIVGGHLLLKHTDETASSEVAGQHRI